MRDIRASDIDKQLRLRAVLLRYLLNFPDERAFRRAQGLMDRFQRGRLAKGIRCEETAIRRKADGTPLRVLVYKSPSPSPEDGAAGLLWIHGGGYAMGLPESDHGFCRRFVDAASCVIVSPDYRLSIHAPYPAALDDCYEALVWMKENARALGVRDDQLFVGGDSAGGGLTAATTLLARDRGEVSVAFQMPLYPMIDDRMNTDSATDNCAPVWNSRSNRAAWQLYLAGLFGTDEVPKYAAPAREQDYSRLPPTFTFVGGIEPFRDETRAYVDNLRSAGVPVGFAEFKGCYHAFEQMCPDADVSRKAVAMLMDAFKHAVAHRFAAQPAVTSDPPRAKT
ncbi:MAG TPA: alpha/beta hydrolase [Myxococcales bacterium]|jgi:acetyl esterase/lipase